MREHLGFLKVSSAVVKIAAWVFLFMGIIGSVAIFMGRMPGKTPSDAILNLTAGVLLFFLFYIIAKMAELIAKIINEIKKE